MKSFSLGLLLFSLLGCISPFSGSVQVNRHYPHGVCSELGQVIGNASTRDDARDEAMADIKENTKRLGGNFVRVIAETAHSRAIRGIAYRCE